MPSLHPAALLGVTRDPRSSGRDVRLGRKISTTLVACIALCAATLMPLSLSAAGQAVPKGAQGGDSGIEVKLILAPEEKLGRALELSRAVREAAPIDRIVYAVSDKGRERAEITHDKDSSPDSIAALVAALAEQMVNDVIVTVRTPDSP